MPYDFILMKRKKELSLLFPLRDCVLPIQEVFAFKIGCLEFTRSLDEAMIGFDVVNTICDSVVVIKTAVTLTVSVDFPAWKHPQVPSTAASCLSMMYRNFQMLYMSRTKRSSTHSAVNNFGLSVQSGREQTLRQFSKHNRVSGTRGQSRWTECSFEGRLTSQVMTITSEDSST